MGDVVLVVSLILVFLAGLLLIPFGLPGLWVMVLAVIGYGALTGFRTVGVATMAIVVGLAVLGEILEAWVGFRYARKYGGSRRAGWGALIGGLIGAVVGVPVPIIGSVIGSFVGAFLGAAIFEYTGSAHAGGAVGAGWGAVLGRTWAMAAKVALGLVIATIGLVAAVRGAGGRSEGRTVSMVETVRTVAGGTGIRLCCGRFKPSCSGARPPTVKACPGVA